MYPIFVDNESGDSNQEFELKNLLTKLCLSLIFISANVLSLCFAQTKEALSVLMLCTPVFIFTSGSSALLGCPRCGLSI